MLNILYTTNYFHYTISYPVATRWEKLSISVFALVQYFTTNTLIRKEVGFMQFKEAGSYTTGLAPLTWRKTLD